MKGIWVATSWRFGGHIDCASASKKEAVDKVMQKYDELWKQYNDEPVDKAYRKEAKEDIELVFYPLGEATFC